MKDSDRERHPRSTLAPPPRLLSLGAYLVIVMLAASVPLAAMLAYQLLRDMQEQHQRLQESLQRSTAMLAAAVQRDLAATIDDLTTLAQPLQRLSPDEHPAFLRRALQEPRHAHWRGVFLRAADGHVVFSSSDTVPPQPRAVAQASVSDLVGERDDPGTLVEVPVGSEGDTDQTLGAWIDASHWQRLVQSGGAPPSGFLGIVGSDRRLIARSDAPQRAGQAVAESALVQMAADPNGTQRAEWSDGEPTYGTWQSLPLSGWAVSARVFAVPIESAQRRAVLTALGTTTACLLLGVALATLLARRITEPLSQLAAGRPALPARPLVHEIAQLHEALSLAQAQEARSRGHLQRKANEFQALFASTPVGLAYMPDAASPHVIHNPAMQSLLGALGEGEPADVQIFEHDRRLQTHEQPLHRAAETGRAAGPIELELRSPGNPPRHVLVRALPLQDRARQTQGAVAAVVDITERKLAEQRLLEADQRLRESQDLIELAQDAGDIGFFQYRFDSSSVTWSPGQARLLGFDPAQPPPPLEMLQGRIAADQREAMQAQLRSMIAARRERESFECCVELADGCSHWLSTRVMLACDAAGKPIQLVGVSLNISQQKTAEREHAALVDAEQSARRQAESASRAKDEFLAMLGHELRNPLGAIASAVAVLDRVDAGTDVAVNARRIIGRQTRHLAHLMDDLLDVGRVISGKVLLSLQRLDLGELIERVISNFEITGQAQGHDLHLDLRSAWVDGDATRLEQVVTNLLGNAFKYTAPGRRIDICVQCSDARALIEVRDQGPGIDAALLPRIFDLFVQAERPIDRPGGGLGIGLTLVRRLVELHGGEVTAHSSAAGTTFQVVLPSAQAPPAQAGAWRAPTPKRRVLVVDDNADVLSVMRSMLELDGHVVSVAEDGLRGLAVLLDERPDVAIVDIGLPGLSGYEVARRGRRAGYAGQLFALSGYSGPKDVARARRHGFDAHLAKPLDPQRLHELLSTR
jgi:signal transduction histidine kinase